MNTNPNEDFAREQPVRRSLRFALTAVLLTSAGGGFILLNQRSTDAAVQRPEVRHQRSAIRDQRSEGRGQSAPADEAKDMQTANDSKPPPVSVVPAVLPQP